MNSMENRFIDIGERFSTVEGKPNQIIYDTSCSPNVLLELEQISKKVIDHILVVSKERLKLKNMVFYAKIGKDLKVWILFFEKLQFFENVKYFPTPWLIFFCWSS